MRSLTYCLRILVVVCLVGLASRARAEGGNAGVDRSTNVDRKTNSGMVTIPLGITSTSRAVAMDVRNQREVKISLANGSVTQFGIATGGRPFFGGDFDGSGTWYVVSSPDTLYSVDTTTGVFTSLGQITGLPPGSNTSGLTWDYSSNTMYLCNLSGGIATLYTLNLASRVATPVGTILTGIVIDIAASNSGQLYGIKFASTAGVSDSLISINKATGAATTVGPLGVDVNFAHGLDFDPVTDSLFYPGYIGSGVNNLYRINTQTGQATLISALAAGEYDCFSVIGRPPVSDSLLVILHDSTLGTSTLKRKADRDTLFAYLQSLVSAYRVVYIDTAGAALPNLNNYKSILYQETSFDDGVVRYLGVSARQALRDWLNAGTPTDRRRFILIGADVGYNYSRSGSGGRDTVLAHQMLKFTYINDNANVTGQNSITGVTVNPGQVYAYSTTPPGSGFWPDGCRPGAGSSVLYKYTGRGETDTVAGVGYVGTGYVAASLFQDPRYFTGTFGPVLRSLLQFTGVITDVPTSSNEIPTDYVLMQNFPNPFNPTTTIRYSLPEAARVNLSVYNILGQRVAELADEMQGAGTHTVLWNGRNDANVPAASGVYFYRLEARPTNGSSAFIGMKKMVLVK